MDFFCSKADLEAGGRVLKKIFPLFLSVLPAPLIFCTLTQTHSLATQPEAIPELRGGGTITLRLKEESCDYVISIIYFQKFFGSCLSSGGFRDQE